MRSLDDLFSSPRVLVLTLLTPLRTKAEEFLSVFSDPKPFDFSTAAVAAKGAAKKDLAVDDIPEQLPWWLCRSRFPVKRSRFVSAVWTGIRGYVAATLWIRTYSLQLAFWTVSAFRGVAEHGHGIIAHTGLFALHVSI